ncbi:MAG: homoaconitate hydratase [Methanomassiliicoccales archaeon]|nr:MAG: homoaconitate hydratase [Methanomassiliicoccales archaeon]
MQQIALSPYNPKIEAKDVIIYDSTLRDGEQTPGMAFSQDQKIEIAEKLDDIGVHQIEAGFPAVCESEQRTVKEICSLGLDADILTLSRITKGDIDCCVDAGVDMVLLFIATSDIHLKYKFKKPREFLLEKVQEGLDYCHERGVKASLSAEDSTRTDLDFLIQIYKKAEEAGAARIGVTDTVGCASPEAIFHIVSEVRKAVKVPIGLHLHNDYGLVLANAIAGVKAGATALTTTVNGIGERAGNLPLEQFAPVMKFVYGCDLGIDCSKLTQLCDLVAEYSRLPRPRNQPLVGPNVFAHESGIHVAAILECPLTYESIPPEAVGNRRHILMGKHTGLTYVKKRVEDLGLKASDNQLSRILNEVKNLGEKKGRVSDDEFKQIVIMVLDKTRS